MAALRAVLLLILLTSSALGQAGTAGAAGDNMTVRELFAIMNERERANGQRFEAQEKAVAAALTSAKEAVVKAENAAEKRFDSVNEFRSTLKDQQTALLPRAEADVRFKSIEDHVATLDAHVNQMLARGEGASWLWMILSGVSGLALGVTALMFRRPTGAKA